MDANFLTTISKACRILDHNKMTSVSRGILTLLIVQVLIVKNTSANMDNATSYFTFTRKPLQCHNLRSVDVRSSVECALNCMKDLYWCSGYVYDSNDASGLRCDVCFIHDVTTPLVTVRTSPSSVSILTEIDKQTGKILLELKRYSVHSEYITITFIYDTHKIIYITQIYGCICGVFCGVFCDTKSE